MLDYYKKLIELERYHHTKLFVKKDYVIVKGKGALLYDHTGKEYIDCEAGHAVMNIGHSHPKFIEAVKNQVEKLVMVAPGTPTEPRAKLLEKLTGLFPKPLTQAFLTNSGTESIETAIKLVIANNRDKKAPEIIAFKRDFHGRTLGSLAITHNPKYRDPFISWISPNVKWASFGDVDSVKELVNENTVAVFCELIQGEGGVHPAPPEFPKQLRELCSEKNLILVDDEVQTGFGRTGKMFAFEHYGIVPDIVCVAKGIAGGLPMGAAISSEALYNKMNVGEHNTTFGGNPLVCAAAIAAIDILLEEKLPEKAEKQGAKIMAELSKLMKEVKTIREVRGKGLMIGVEYKTKVKEAIDKAEELGVLLLNAGITVIRLVPPLVITDEQVNKVLSVMREISK